jgi:hypothetical protein
LWKSSNKYLILANLLCKLSAVNDAHGEKGQMAAEGGNWLKSASLRSHGHLPEVAADRNWSNFNLRNGLGGWPAFNSKLRLISARHQALILKPFDSTVPHRRMRPGEALEVQKNNFDYG